MMNAKVRSLYGGFSRLWHSPLRSAHQAYLNSLSNVDIEDIGLLWTSISMQANAKGYYLPRRFQLWQPLVLAPTLEADVTKVLACRYRFSIHRPIVLWFTVSAPGLATCLAQRN